MSGARECFSTERIGALMWEQARDIDNLVDLTVRRGYDPNGGDNPGRRPVLGLGLPVEGRKFATLWRFHRMIRGYYV